MSRPLMLTLCALLAFAGAIFTAVRLTLMRPAPGRPPNSVGAGQINANIRFFMNHGFRVATGPMTVGFTRAKYYDGSNPNRPQAGFLGIEVDSNTNLTYLVRNSQRIAKVRGIDSYQFLWSKNASSFFFVQNPGLEESSAMFNEKSFGPHRFVHLLAVSDDGSRFAYFAVDRDGKRTLVVDGKPDGAYVSVPAACFTPDAKSIYIVAKRQGDKNLMVFHDGSVMDTGIVDVPATPARRPQFVVSPDGKHWALCGRRDQGLLTVAADGDPPARAGNVADDSLQYAPNNDLYYAAQIGGAYRVVRNQAPVGPAWKYIRSLLVLSNGGYACIAYPDGDDMTFHRENEYIKVGPPAIVVDGKVIVQGGLQFAASADGGGLLWVKEIKPDAGANEELWFGNSQVAVLPKNPQVFALAVSPNGAHWAAVVTSLLTRQALWVDGTQLMPPGSTEISEIVLEDGGAVSFSLKDNYDAWRLRRD